MASTLFTILNAMFILWETQHRATAVSQHKSRTDMEAWHFQFAAVLFGILFVLDVALRVLAERAWFFQSREWGWNIFDIIVCASAVAEIVQHHFASGSQTFAEAELGMFLRNFSMLRILRLLRIIRMTRAIRVIKFMRELRLMVFSLTGAMKSLFWCVVLMLIIFLFFGVIFTDGAIQYCMVGDVSAESTDKLVKYFGTLPSATVSLWMAMSGGEDWGNIMYALQPLPGEYKLLFLGFITFSVLALLNVVTAVFVGAAMEQTQADREMIVQQEVDNKGEFVLLMQQIFTELDSNQSGSLRFEEFEKHVDDEKIMAFFRTLEIDISQVRTLFTLLDTDDTGEVDLDEFVEGCVRLRGGATSMDMAVLKYQVDWIVKSFRALNSSLAQHPAALGNTL